MLSGIGQNRPLPERIRDRVVLVGRMSEASGTSQSQADAMYTPFFASTGQLMAGVEVQGNIIHTMLNGRAGQEISVALRLGLYLLVTVLFSFLVARFSPWKGLLIIFAGMLLILGFSIYAFGAWNFWMPPILVCAGLPLIYTGNVLTQYVMEVREKSWLRNAFGRYVAPEVVKLFITAGAYSSAVRWRPRSFCRPGWIHHRLRSIPRRSDWAVK
jgi:adenylate cyclase